MGLEVVDLVADLFFPDVVSFLQGRVQFPEQMAQFTRIRLLEEAVQFLDQFWNRSFFMDRLIRQRPEFRAQCSHHPAGKVEVTAFCFTEMFLDRNHFLLPDKSVPAAQRLGVMTRVTIVSGHVFTHDACSVTGDVESGFEPVLKPHSCDVFGVDGVPGFTLLDDGLVGKSVMIGPGRNDS